MRHRDELLTSVTGGRPLLGLDTFVWAEYMHSPLLIIALTCLQRETCLSPWGIPGRRIEAYVKWQSQRGDESRTQQLASILTAPMGLHILFLLLIQSLCQK